MKKNKSAITSLLCMTIIVSILIGQITYCAHRTLLSPSHFGSMLEKSDKLSQLTALVYDSISNSTDDTGALPIVNRYVLNIMKRTDQEWLKGQVYIGATGLHKYIAGEATTLPTFDFVPLNKIIKDYLTSEAMHQPNTEEKIEKIKTVLTILSNKYLSGIIRFGLSNQLTSMLLELAPIRSTGFDRSTLQEIIRIYLSFSSKTTTIDQASYEIVTQMTADALELNRLKDYFDSNLFLEKAFGKNNPIASFKTMIGKIDTSISISNNIILFCLLLLLLINLRFSLFRMIKTLLYCALLASILNLLLSVLFIIPSITKELLSLAAPSIAFQRFLIGASTLLLRDFGFYLSLQSVLSAVVLLVLYLLVGKISQKEVKSKSGKNSFSALRLYGVIFIIILAAFMISISSINRAIADFRSTIQAIAKEDMLQSIKTGLTEAGGMHFLRYLQKK